MGARLLLQIFSLELRKILSYRLDFWTNFIGTIFVEFCMAYFLWQAIFMFRGVDEIGGYTFKGMMLYYLLVPVIGHIVQAQVMHFMSSEIYDGSLNRYLVYPLNFFGYKVVAHLAFSFIGVLQFGLVLVLYFAVMGIPADIPMSGASVAMGLVASIAGAILYFVVAGCLEMTAFWADNIWSLLAMLRMIGRFFGGALIPLALFPEWAEVLCRILPFYAYVGFPVEAMLGHLSWLQWLANMGLCMFWIVVFSGLLVAIWRRGQFRYTGVGI